MGVIAWTSRTSCCLFSMRVTQAVGPISPSVVTVVCPTAAPAQTSAARPAPARCGRRAGARRRGGRSARAPPRVPGRGWRRTGGAPRPAGRPPRRGKGKVPPGTGAMRLIRTFPRTWGRLPVCSGLRTPFMPERRLHIQAEPSKKPVSHGKNRSTAEFCKRLYLHNIMVHRGAILGNPAASVERFWGRRSLVRNSDSSSSRRERPATPVTRFLDRLLTSIKTSVYIDSHSVSLSRTIDEERRKMKWPPRLS